MPLTMRRASHGDAGRTVWTPRTWSASTRDVQAGKHRAAGVIHIDFQRGSIKAEIVSFDDLVEAGSMNAATSGDSGRTQTGTRTFISPGP